MRCSLDGLLINAGRARDDSYAQPLAQLLANLRELRQRTQAGDMAAVEEFFDVYTVKGADA